MGVLMQVSNESGQFVVKHLAEPAGREDVSQSLPPPKKSNTILTWLRWVCNTLLSDEGFEAWP